MADLHRAVVEFQDTPQGGCRIQFKFYELSSETLTPQRTLTDDEANALIKKSPSIGAAFSMLNDLSDKMERLGIRG